MSGNVDHLKDLQQQKAATDKKSKGGYGLTTGKAEQNVDNRNKRIKSSKDLKDLED